MNDNDFDILIAQFGRDRAHAPSSQSDAEYLTDRIIDDAGGVGLLRAELLADIEAHRSSTTAAPLRAALRQPTVLGRAADRIWNAVDDRGITGRITRADAEHLAAIAIAGLSDDLRQLREHVEEELLDHPAHPFVEFDQDQHLGTRLPYDEDDRRVWERAHGHDVRTKCYAEYGCLVLGGRLARAARDLAAAVAALSSGGDMLAAAAAAPLTPRLDPLTTAALDELTPSRAALTTTDLGPRPSRDVPLTTADGTAPPSRDEVPPAALLDASAPSTAEYAAETQQGDIVLSPDRPLAAPWMARIAELAALPNGWDRGEGRAIRSLAITAAQQLLRSIDALGITIPGIFPMHSGGVQLEWQQGNHVASVEIEIHDTDVYVAEVYDLFDLDVDDHPGVNIEGADHPAALAFVTGLSWLPEPQKCGLCRGSGRGQYESASGATWDGDCISCAGTGRKLTEEQRAGWTVDFRTGRAVRRA